MPTLTYICEFNLEADGPEAESFLTNALRTWPALYDELDGVKGTRLLANAFGLAGEFNYEWQVDLDSFKALEGIDRALKSDDRRWQEARREWFANRSRVRARLLQRADDESDDIGEGEGPIYLIAAYHSSNGGVTETRSSVSEILRKGASVIGVEHHAAVVKPAVGPGQQSAARLRGIGELDQFLRDESDRLTEVIGPSSTRLLAELSEVDGALVSGA